MRLRFTKVDGAGNDYLVVNTADSTCRGWPEVARVLCRRQHGVGADGLVVFTHLGHARFTVRCLNPDGTASAANGNAMRGCAHAIHGRYGYRTMTLVAGDVPYQAVVAGPAVAVAFPPAGPVRAPRSVDGRGVHPVFVGGEHAVAVVADLASLDPLDVASAGARIRRDPALGPLGANVGFLAPAGGGRLRLRSYERGVERETLSSGSGAIAAVLVARAVGLVDAGVDRVEVETGGGDLLAVTLAADGSAWVSGPAVEVFTGETRWEEAPASQPAGVREAEGGGRPARPWPAGTVTGTWA